MSDHSRSDDSKVTGAGSEAAEGIHSVTGRSPQQTSGVEGARTGLSESGGGDAQGGVRMGSEPLSGRGTVHESGYGGAAARPKTSSNEREPGNVAETERQARQQADGALGDEEAGDGLGQPDSSGARNVGKERGAGSG